MNPETPSKRSTHLNAILPTSLEKLHTLLASPESAIIIQENMARQLHTNLHDYLGKNLTVAPADPEGRLHVWSREAFNHCFTPEHPTVVVDTLNSFSGHEMLGLAAAMDDLPINIVYTAGVWLKGQEVAPTINHGAMIDKTGHIHFGPLPEPVSAQMIDTHDIGILSYCNLNNIATTQTLDALERLHDKHNLPELLHGTSVLTPRRIPSEALAEELALHDIVIKPGAANQGSGVKMLPAGSSPAKAGKYYEYLLVRGYRPIIEERIRCLPVIRQADQQLDWNVRALLAHGQMIDAYVRYGAAGRPVNLSRSAQAMLMSDMLDELKPETANRIETSLLRGCRDIASRADGYVGVDFAIATDGSLYAFEVNTGHVGGLQTIARLSNPEGALKGSVRIVRAWIDHMSHTPAAIHVEHHTPESAVAPRFTTLAMAAKLANRKDALATVRDGDIPWRNGQEAGGLYITALARRAIHRKPATEHDEYDLFRDHPLETLSCIDYLAQTAASPTNYLESLEELASHFKIDPTLRLARLAIAASDWDLRGLDALVQTDYALSAPQEALTLKSFAATCMLSAQRLAATSRLLEGQTDTVTRATLIKVAQALVYQTTRPTWTRQETIDATGAEPKTIVIARFLLAFCASKHHETVRLYSRLLKDNVAGAVRPFVEGLRRHPRYQRYEDQRTMITLDLLSGKAFRPLTDYYTLVDRSAMPLSNRHRKELSRLIANNLPVEATPDQRKWLRALLFTDRSADELVSRPFDSLTNIEVVTRIIQRHRRGEVDEADREAILFSIRTMPSDTGLS